MTVSLKDHPEALVEGVLLGAVVGDEDGGVTREGRGWLRVVAGSVVLEP